MITGKPDLVTVLEDHGIELNQRAGKLWACCPLHGEKAPSFKVEPDRQEFYCFGCHEHGDVITFIQKLKGITFKDAVRYLGITTGTPSPDQQRRYARERRKRSLLQNFRAWETQRHTELCNFYRAIQKMRAAAKNEDDLNRIADLYHRETEILAGLDILESGSDERKYQLYQRGRP